MKKKNLIALLLVFSLVLCLAACGKGEQKAETVTVSFDTDGGDAVAAQVINKGGAAVKPATPKKAGYIFDKWMLGDKEYEFGSAVNEDITLKAAWIDPNSGSSGGSSGSGGSGGSEGSGGSGGSSSSDAKVDELYWVNNWYWVQEKCEGDPEYVVKPESMRDKVTFTSSDTTIATVNSKGIVYGVKPGNVTITMKCGDKTADLPLEVRAEPKPSISLDTSHLVLQYHNNEVSNDLHAFTVSFSGGADPSSPVTWTSSNPAVADVTSWGVVGANDLGYTMITATTAEGYTATCDVYVTGTALRVYYNHAPLHYGESFSISGLYELSLVEDHYYDNGFSKSVYVTNQCTMMAAAGIGFDPQSEYYANFYFNPSYISTEKYYSIQFRDPLNNVSSNYYEIYIY